MAEPAKYTTHKIYGGEIEIDFYPNSHRYKVNGSWVKPSVSTIKSIPDKSMFLVPWAVNCMRDELIEKYKAGQFSEEIIEVAKNAHRRVKEDAGGIGDVVHKFGETFARNQISGSPKPELPTDERAVSGCLAFMKWVEERKVKFVSVECMVYSKKLGIIGTFDVEYTMDGKPDLRLGDLKTANRFYPLEDGMQTALYKFCREEEYGEGHITGRDIIRLDKETGEYEVHPLPNYEKDLEAAMACRTVVLYKYVLAALYPSKKK